MFIKNGFLLQDDQLIQADIQFEERITNIGQFDEKPDIDATDCYVVPGFVDIHTHGAMSADFSDGKTEDIQTMMDFYAEHGVTSVLGTTMTLKEPVLQVAMESMRSFKREGGAKLAGIHLEGPFLCAAKKGAQAEDNLHVPDVEMFKRLNEASGNMIHLVTVACEEPGGMEFVKEISKICTVSLGHTIADYDKASEAYQNGASHATHLYNGMPSLLHRAPGVIGAAMDNGATAELICDGMHVHPSAVRAAYAMFQERLVLISDSLRCAGMPNGDYVLGGQPIQMKDGVAYLTGTNTLAGSALSLHNGVLNAVRFGIPIARAFYAASTAPAKAAGLHDVGSLEVGKSADILVLDKDLMIKHVFINGEKQ